ncbi:PD-(D/E)XK nuclease family protein [Candidatus Bipolaricaulota bacterium]|nr:PD-(D/E)XK nuclease family protein [Candidatus Bipolaricaulota bacterium]
MSKDFKNNFSWSNSRLSTFKSCKRKYYFQYYGFWDGWEDDASERVRTIYRLKKLNNRHTWKGTIIHEAIAFLIKSLLENEKLNRDEFKKAVVGKMRVQYKTSNSGDYKSDPKDNFGLLEHEYNEEISDETWQLLKESVFRSLDNFRGSKFWKKAKTLTQEDCLALEGNLKGSENNWKTISPNLNTWKNLPSGAAADHFTVDGVKVWVKIDFAYPEDDGSIRLIDWKSGNSESEPDSTQLNIYGYYASKVWCDPEEKIHLTAYNVNRDEQYDRTFSKEGKQETREKILNSVENMKELLVNREENEAKEEDFPKKENDNFCRHCRYRQVCKPELVE